MIPQQDIIKDALPPHTPSPLSADTDATVTGTDIVYLADLQPQPVEWLWQHRLAAGTLAMLSGEPGSGKTWVTLAIAAALTCGRDPFTGEKLKPATVLYASAEHSAAQVIQPRFAGLHGDPAQTALLHVKSNLGPLAPPLDYRIGEARASRLEPLPTQAKTRLEWATLRRHRVVKLALMGRSPFQGSCTGTKGSRPRARVLTYGVKAFEESEKDGAKPLERFR